MPILSSSRRPGRALVIVPFLLLGACSTGGQRITSSGFLADYSRLHAEKGRKDTALWVAPTYDAGRYREVVVDMPEWHSAPREPEVQARLAADLREELVRRLGGRYRVVDASRVGSGAIRVRAAITNLRRTRWYLNVPAQAASFALGGIGLFAPLQGGASEEIQVEDVATGAVLVQIATFRNGKPWNVKGSYVAYDHARMAFREAAKRLDSVLEGRIDAVE